MRKAVAIAGEQLGMGLLAVAVFVVGNDVAAAHRLTGAVGGGHLADVHPVGVDFYFLSQDINAVVTGAVDLGGTGVEEDLDETGARRPAAHAAEQFVHQDVAHEIRICLIGGVQRPVRFRRHAAYLARLILIGTIPEFDRVALLGKAG